MSSIGPSLPPHLQKRKRSNDDSDAPTSPPRKVIAASNPRVLGPSLPPAKNGGKIVNGDESSEDDYGPSVKGPALPKEAPPPQRAVGPSMPPSHNPDELDLDDSDDDCGPSIPKEGFHPPRRVLGPAPPPAALSERPSQSPDDESSDDDYGPSLPPVPGSAAHEAFIQRQEAASHPSTASAPAKAQREEWMLAPPTDSDWTSRIDTTKLKARKFASGKSAASKPPPGGGIASVWTETPEEKRRRLADEVMGRAELSTSSRPQVPGGGGTVRDREAEKTEKRIREYNEKVRGKSLYEVAQDQKAQKGEKVEEDDPSKRGFDREKDMALGGKLGEGQKREMLAKSKDFGSRFSKGKYL